MLGTYLRFVLLVRYVVFGVAVVTALVAFVDWAVRTRRLAPFGFIARFFRRVVDPVLAPIEARVVKSGGLPSNAPWWTLVVVVVGGLILIAALNVIGGLLAQLAAGLSSGRGLAFLVLSWTFGLLRLALLVRVISSWLPVSPWSRWIRWSYVLTDWMLAPLRRLIPAFKGIDITPIAAWFLLYLLEGLVLGGW